MATASSIWLAGERAKGNEENVRPTERKFGEEDNDAYSSSKQGRLALNEEAAWGPDDEFNLETTGGSSSLQECADRST